VVGAFKIKLVTQLTDCLKKDNKYLLKVDIFMRNVGVKFKGGEYLVYVGLLSGPDLPWWMSLCSAVVDAPRPQTIPHPR